MKTFQERVQQARTTDEYEQLKQELSERLNGLSPHERHQLRQEFKPIWNDLNSRVDGLIADVEELNRRVTA